MNDLKGSLCPFLGRVLLVFQGAVRTSGSGCFFTQGLQSRSFLVMTYFLLRDYNIQPKKELPWSLWVKWRSSLGVCK